MPFSFHSLALPGVILVRPHIFPDARGLFFEAYKRSEFQGNNIPDALVQENQSMSVRGTVRGLHYQRPPHGQAKLIRVVAGEIFDVAVDIRSESPTFGKWVGVRLSASDRNMLYVPPGFAHGFSVLSEQAEVLYKTSAEYRREAESGVAWNDPDIGIPWGITAPIISRRDESWPRLRDLQRLDEAGHANTPVHGQASGTDEV